MVDQIHAQQVLFLNRGDFQKHQKSSESSEKIENCIYTSFVSRLPCTWIDIDDNSAPALLQKSNSLFLYVGVEDGVDQSFVKNLKGLTLNFRAPIRVLFIMLNRNTYFTVSYLDLLEQFWQKQLIEVTIIGISSSVSKHRHKIGIMHRKVDYALNIYQYNPFTRAYTNQPLDSSSIVFPTKLNDLHGHELRLGFVQNPLQSLHGRNSQKIEAFVDQLLSTIQRKLNFSVELDSIPISDVSHLLHNDSISDAVQEIISLRHLDVYASGAHLTYNEQPFPTYVTTTIAWEQLCAVVPVMRKKLAFQLSSGVQWSLLVILCLVTIVWLWALLLIRRRDASLSLSQWRPLDVCLMMMGTPITARVVTFRERLLFGCVLLVASFYSSTMLAHLTRLNFNMEAHKRFETYGDLDESGLKPVIDPSLMNITFGDSDDPELRRLGKKAVQFTDKVTCLDWLLNYANVSCVMGEFRILALLSRYSKWMKLANPCFWSTYQVLVMRQGSPYTPSFNRIIRVTQESGIARLWKNSQQKQLHVSGFTENNISIHRLEDNSHKNVFFLLLMGVSVGHEMMKWIRVYCMGSFLIAFVNSYLWHCLPIAPLISQINARQVLFLYRSNNQKYHSTSELSNYMVLFLYRGDHPKYQRNSKSSEEIVNWIYSSFVSRLRCAWIDIDKNNVSILLQKSNSLFVSSYWRPLNICLMMMGSPITAQAVTLRERFLFGSVLLLSLFYSSSILVHLTNLKLDLKAYPSFKTYQELDESGLIPVVDPYWFNMTFRFSNDPALNRLGEKAFLSSERRTCVYWLLNYANVSCILGQHYIRLYTAMFSGKMKQAEPCFWSTYRAFIVRKGSPYLPSFNRIIHAAYESGKVQSFWQHYYEFIAQLRNEHRVNVTGLIEENSLPDKLRNNSYRNVFFLLFAGYLLSLAVFFIELAFNNFHTKLQRLYRISNGNE
uniref:Ionotropic glutamate receptor C-terminal domain-containing protein n=1 Tax=Trichogramma kaykai TaxID=54128 RepID=A0ABD2XNB5_9HYME